jgi:hypothetical protein
MRFSNFVAAGVMSTAIVAAVGAGTGSMTVANAQSGPAWGPQWTADGELVLPEGFHEWVFVGSPLTPNALNDGQAGFPEYHNVYVRPEPLKIYRDTGEWPDGTIMLKELQLMLPGTNADGSREEASGRGFFPGALNGIDISVKDSRRFEDTNDWGFFNFGHHAPPYAETAVAAPADECAACHMANPEGMVFRQFYSPILNSR